MEKEYSISQCYSLIKKNKQFIQHYQVISSNNYYSNTFLYSPINLDDEQLFLNKTLRNVARNGLVLYVPITSVGSTKSNEGVCRVLQRGLPKLYEFIPDANYYEEFNKTLMNIFEENSDKNKKISKVSLKHIRILTDHLFYLSLDKDQHCWIVSLKNECCIFRKLSEIEKLNRNDKVSNILYFICRECTEIIDRVLSNMEVQKDFIQSVSSHTYAGFYSEDKNEIYFFSAINTGTKINECSIPLDKFRDLCMNFGIPYKKYMNIKSDIFTITQLKDEINTLYKRIAYDFSNRQNLGGIIVIEKNDKIEFMFKIFNQEMVVLSNIKEIKFGLKNRNLPDIEKLKLLENLIKNMNLPRENILYKKMMKHMQMTDSLNKISDFLEDLSNIRKKESKNNSSNKNLCLKKSNSFILPTSNIIIYSNGKAINTTSNSNEITQNTININVNNKININNSTLNIMASSHSSIKLNRSPSFLIGCGDKYNIYNISNKAPAKKKLKVKFLDEAYNKPLVTEIKIKSYKINNNDSKYTESKGSKQTNCCICF